MNYNYQLSLVTSILIECMNKNDYYSFYNIYFNIANSINDGNLIIDDYTKYELNDLLLELNDYYITSVIKLTK